MTLLPDPESLYSDTESSLNIHCSAWAKAALALRTGVRFGHNNDSMRLESLWIIHERLEVFRRQFEGGNTFALLDAVSLCAEENLPLPTWLASAYCDALKNFQTIGGPASLDDVFQDPKNPIGTPQKSESYRRDWQLGAWLWSSAWQLAMRDESITSLNVLTMRVLEESPPIAAPWRQWPVKKTKARELIQMIDKNQGELLNWPANKALSHFLAKRRKRV